MERQDGLQVSLSMVAGSNDVEPTEVDAGFIIDVYTTPPMPVLP